MLDDYYLGPTARMGSMPVESDMEVCMNPSGKSWERGACTACIWYRMSWIGYVKFKEFSRRILGKFKEDPGMIT